MSNRLTSTRLMGGSASLRRRLAARGDTGEAAFRPSTRARTGIRARSVGAYVPGLTQKAFDKFGFSAVALISDWKRIAGPGLASHTAPERLKWPRPVGKYAATEDGCEGRPGATLILRVEPARALDVEYGRSQLIERINGYFGYRAVDRIKIIQAPLNITAAVPEPPADFAPARLPAQPQKPPAAKPAGVSDPDLAAALERLQRTISVA